MPKTSRIIVRIGEFSAVEHALKGEEFQYDDRMGENITWCGRSGIMSPSSYMSGKELPVTCKACQEAGPRWIVYMYTGIPQSGFGLTTVENLKGAVTALEKFSGECGVDDVTASLYPYSPENWEDAEEFRTGCPFDYPSRLILRGARGGFRVVEA